MGEDAGEPAAGTGRAGVPREVTPATTSAVPTAVEQQARRLSTACAVRWLGVLASALAVLTANPPPVLSPAAPWLVTVGLAAFNGVALVLLRRSPACSERLVVPSLVVDFVACAGWMLIGANAPTDTRFIFFTAVSIEAATLLRWRGAVAVLAGFLVVHTGEFVERAAVFGFTFSASSLVLRSSAIAMVALFSGAMAEENERRRRELIRTERAAMELTGLEQELTLLRETAAVMSSALDLDGVLSTVVRTAALMVPAPQRPSPHASILRVRHGALHCAVEYSEGVAVRGEGVYDADAHPVLRAAIDTRRVMSGRLCLVPRGAAAGTAPAPSRDVAVAPLVVDGEVFGVLLVGLAHPDEIGEAALRRLEGVSRLAELALGNARAHGLVRRSAVTDLLTGIDNRRGFEQALERLPRVGFAILAIDVDNLKTINDAHGHEAGDEILRTVGRALADSLRDGDVVGRTGGDEFAVLLPAAGAAEAESAADRIRGVLERVAPPHGPARVSVGIAAGAAGEAPHTVWKQADAALYVAKRTGRDRVRRPQSGSGASRWDETVRGVIDSGSVTCVYQPIVHLDSGRLAGVEALARPCGWEPGIGVEGMFSTAHRIGLSRELDWVCRRNSIAAAATLPETLSVFINTTVALLVDGLHPVDQLLLLLRSVGRDPRTVVLEITEREPVSDLPRLRRAVTEHRGCGVRFAVDDVGEGPSSLALLAAVAPEFVKLSGSLTATAGERRSRAAIEAAVAFARSSGTIVIAEGLESRGSLEILAAAGVQCGQGMLLGAPAPAAALHRGPLSLGGPPRRTAPS